MNPDVDLLVTDSHQIDPNSAFLRGLLWRLTVVPVDNVAPDYGFVKVGPTVQPIIFSEQY